MQRKQCARYCVDPIFRFERSCFLIFLNANILSAQYGSQTLSGNREYARLGIEVTNSPARGVMFKVVSVDSPADHSDMRPGGFLLSVNGIQLPQAIAILFSTRPQVGKFNTQETIGPIYKGLTTIPATHLASGFQPICTASGTIIVKRSMSVNGSL